MTDRTNIDLLLNPIRFAIDIEKVTELEDFMKLIRVMLPSIAVVFDKEELEIAGQLVQKGILTEIETDEA